MDVRYAQVTKRFGAVEALRQLDLSIPDGTFLVMLGPSGCGKTTALRVLAGLEQPTGGQVYIGKREVTRLEPRDRDIAMVFQSYALYPHMSVRENIGYPLKIRGMPRDDRKKLVQRVAEGLEIGHLLDRHPRQLSGGQRQRVALARAIVRKPAVFLMDEPLSNLDAKLRVQMRGELKRLQKDLGVTTLYVTHDQSEATTMADVVAVMQAGTLEQATTPRRVYDYPTNRFVATFVGHPPMSVFDVDATDGRLFAAGQRISLPDTPLRQIFAAGAGQPLSIGVRAEDVLLAPPDGEGINTEVYLVQPMDNETLVTFRFDSIQVVGRFGSEFNPPMGSRARIQIRPDRLHIFDRGTAKTVLSTRQLSLAAVTQEQDAV
jgi:multiple sugar transport system ATP-binding protein